MLAILALLLIAAPAAGIGSLFSLVLLPVVFLYGWYLKVGAQKRLREDPLFETLIEVVLIGAGLAAIIWNH